MKEIETVFGVNIKDEIEDKWRPVETIVLLKCINKDDGDTMFVYRVSDGLNLPEQVGLLQLYQDHLRDDWRGYR